MAYHMAQYYIEIGDGGDNTFVVSSRVQLCPVGQVCPLTADLFQMMTMISQSCEPITLRLFSCCSSKVVQSFFLVQQFSHLSHADIFLTGVVRPSRGMVSSSRPTWPKVQQSRDRSLHTITSNVHSFTDESSFVSSHFSPVQKLRVQGRIPQIFTLSYQLENQPQVQRNTTSPLHVNIQDGC